MLPAGYRLSFDRAEMDALAIHSYLAVESYWAAGRPLEAVKTSIAHSFCVGIFHENAQIGFARAVTDYAVFAYVADVYILPAHQGKGLGKYMMQAFFHHPALGQVERWLLQTQDAHTLYAKFGFHLPEQPGRIMGRRERFVSESADSND